MKKIIILALALSLLVPAAAFAKADFSLGGFIKLDTWWDSTGNSKNINGLIARNNQGAGHHGAFKMTSQASRFNLTIKGPELFGAKTTGFIEMDFDPVDRPRLGVDTASNSYTPRLRHAMFRLTWPETELLMGQYWSLFSSWYAETTEDGPFQITGTPTARMAQIRLTQKFLGDWAAILLIGDPFNNVGASGAAPTFFGGELYSGNFNNGESAETPMIQGSIKYAHDWWGKAAYYGSPRPFTVQIMAGWQRNVARPAAVNALGSFNAGNTPADAYIDHTYVNPWCVMGTVFIPVIPTHSANLAGTASILAQYFIGQGLTAFGFTGDATNVLNYDSVTGLGTLYNIELIKRWGGFVQGQYYFTNQWFVNVAYAMSKTFGVDQGFFNAAGVPSVAYTNVNNQISLFNQVDAALWYRPVKALKFGLQYAYAHNTYFTNTAQTVGANLSNHGDEHRVQFVGYFYF